MEKSELKPYVPLAMEEALKCLPTYSGVYAILSQNKETTKEALGGLENYVLRIIGRVIDPDERKSLVNIWDKEKKYVDEEKMKAISESMKLFSYNNGNALSGMEAKHIPLELASAYRDLLEIYIKRDMKRGNN